MKETISFTISKDDQSKEIKFNTFEDFKAWAEANFSTFINGGQTDDRTEPTDS